MMFLIDADDRAAIAELPGGPDVTVYKAGKNATNVWATVEPEAIHDQGTRLAALAALRELPETPGTAAFTELKDLLSSDLDDLSAEGAATIAEVLANDNFSDEETTQWTAFRESLERVRETHADALQSEVRAALIKREPPFLMYDANARQLEGEYPLDLEGEQPEPLVDLLALGGSDLGAVRDAAAGESKLPLFTLLERINRTLAQLFALYWKQDALSVELSVVHDRLVITVKNQRTGIYTDLRGHSDGFRSFLALLAFTAARATGTVKPILLVDEADLHLHYDAQAALVEMFTNQNFAAKIIYTTHSAGCLPDDLGGSVRHVRASGPSTSEVVNGIWSNATGVQPLLLALGASSFAFGAVRRALFVEGPSDAILLPRLIRDVRGSGPLGFQVVPGLAWLRAEGVQAADSEAGAAAYLVDGDAEGFRIQQSLVEAGIDSDRVLALSSSATGELVLEDLVDRQILVEAVNSLARLLRGTDAVLASDDLVATSNTAVALEQWYDAHGVAPLPKPLVAQQVIRLAQSEDGVERRVIAEEHVSLVYGLSDSVRRILRVGSPMSEAMGLQNA